MIEATVNSPPGFARTLAVAIAVALVCSAAVTTAVQYLRPMQLAYSDLARNTAIVQAAYGQEAVDSKVVEQFLALQRFYVNPQRGTITKAPGNATAKHVVPVFVAQSGDAYTFVFPVTAKGMWSDIDCYVALDTSLNTIVRLVIYEHAETPGIGDRIEDGQWLRSFAGKDIYDREGQAYLQVGMDATVPARHRVDAITGATISSAAIGSAMRSAFGEGGFASVRAPLRAFLDIAVQEDRP